MRGGQWDITVSKTGFIREAGKCLVMLANIASRPVVIVLLDSYGKLTRIGDANRVKHWLETGESLPASKAIPRTTAKTKRVERHAFADVGQGQRACPNEVDYRTRRAPHRRELPRSSARALLRQQLLRVRARLGGDLVAAQHARELLDPGASASGASSVATRSRLPILVTR